MGELLKNEIDAPSVLPLGNFDAYVSEEGHSVVVVEAYARVVRLPPNTTAVCQPFDVRVMGPFKAKIRSRFSLVRAQTAKEKCMRGIKVMIAVWEELSEELTIRRF